MENNDGEKQPLLSMDNTSNYLENEMNPTPDRKQPDQNNSDTVAFRNRVIGVILVIMAGMSFTGSNIIQKFVIPEVTFWQLLFTRALVQTVLTGLTCLIMHYKFRPGMILLLKA